MSGTFKNFPIPNRRVYIWGAPVLLLSVEGTIFGITVALEILKSLGIDETRITSYDPEGDGLVKKGRIRI